MYVVKALSRIMLSTISSTNTCLANISNPSTEKIIARLSGESGFRTIKATLLAINISKNMGLKMNKAISGIAILLGRERRLFKRSFKHFTHKPISWLARRSLILNFAIKLDGKLV